MAIYAKFVGNFENKRVPVKEQKSYIDSFPEPKNDFQRTRFHYKCRFYKGNLLYRVLLNIAAGVLTLPCVLFFLINGLRKKAKEQHNAFLINGTRLKMEYSMMIPDELTEEFKNIFVRDYPSYPDIKNGSLDLRSFRLWFGLFLRYPFSGFMNFNCLLNLSSICTIVSENAPKMILNYRVESNFTSSLLTHYCEENMIEYVCFMHGDYVTSKERAFVRFSRMYLWDEMYKKIFSWSRCPEEQYRVYFPKMYILPESNIENKSEYFMTYYCSGNDSYVIKLAPLFKELAEKEKKCKVRPHPRFSNEVLLKKVFGEIGVEVEDFRTVSLQDSIDSSENAAALCSTVLSQAFYMNKSIIIDDISDPDMYNDLKERMSISLVRPYRLLSSVKDGLLIDN